MNANQHGDDIVTRVVDLDTWERDESERLARVGKTGVSPEPYHQNHANELSTVANAAMSRHPNREQIKWHVGLSTTTDRNGNNIPTPVIYVHRTDGGTISNQDQQAAYRLIIGEMVQRKMVAPEDAGNLIRSRPVADGAEYSVPSKLWPMPPGIKWIRPGTGSADAFEKPVSSRGGWAYMEAHTNPSSQLPQHSSGDASPGIYFHGTEQEFDEFKYDGDEQSGVFFTPDVRTAAVYGGAVDMTDEGVKARTPLHWSEISPSSRVVAARIDTEGMPKLSEADAWLRKRGAHPADDPEVKRLVEEYPAVETDQYGVEGVVDPFWIKYRNAWESGASIPGSKPRSKDYFWGPVAEHLHQEGAPGMRTPDSLLSSIDQESPEDAEVAVYDPSRVEAIGETRPRYVMMDQDIHNTMSPVRARTELEIYDGCAAELGDLYRAVDDLDTCNQGDGECDDKEAAIIEARRAMEACATNADGMAVDYRGATRSLGGDPTFDELRTALQERRMDPAATAEFRRGLLGEESWPPADYRDPVLAREHLSEALETGYVAPRSEIRPRGLAPNADLEDAISQFKAEPATRSRETPPVGTSPWKKNTNVGRAQSPVGSGRGKHEMRRL